MRRIESVKLVLEAIRDVKERIDTAPDGVTTNILAGDLYALEACLVTEASELIKELEAV